MAYIYYILYKFTLLTPSRKEQPEHIANIVLALVLCFNSFVVINILQYYNVDFVGSFFKQKEMFIVLYISILFAGYFLFIRKKKYVAIKDKYDKESKKKKLLKTSFVIFYIATIFILAFVI